MRALMAPSAHGRNKSNPVVAHVEQSRCLTRPCMQIWGRLTREADPAIARNPELHTLLPVPNPFVVPGARFREVQPLPLAATHELAGLCPAEPSA